MFLLNFIDLNLRHMPTNEQKNDHWCPRTTSLAVKSPWHQLRIDFVGPLTPPAEDGSRYILTLSDYFTKWVEAVPTPDKSANGVAAARFKLIVYHVASLEEELALFCN